MAASSSKLLEPRALPAQDRNGQDHTEKLQVDQDRSVTFAIFDSETRSCTFSVGVYLSHVPVCLPLNLQRINASDEME
jgi:hypothetical protein